MTTALVVVLVLSILLQFSAAAYALWLIRITGLKYAWILISASLFLMGTRRSIPLYHVLTNPDYGADLVNEVIGLVLSLFMLIGVRGIGPLFIERKQSEERIKLLLTEKETLLRELYHRTKNTMQVIRGLIVLQAAEFSTNTDIQQLVKNTENRIQAISLVHQKLYKSQDLSHICIREYITELSALIVQSYSISGDRISLDIAIDDQCFLLDTAIPLGLILNELMTNSLKHAFPDNRNGKISISFKEKDSRKNIFVYYDDGIGVPDGFDLKKQPTLGSKLISSIVEQQLQGNISITSQNGLRYMIEFTNDLYSIRV